MCVVSRETTAGDGFTTRRYNKNISIPLTFQAEGKQMQM
jgi:hypothetical protein